MKFYRTISAAIAMLLTVIMACACMSCTSGRETPESNMLKDFPEVVEFNKNSVVPELLGTPRSELGNGYELRSGVANHVENYLSTDNLDVSYMLGTREIYSEGETPASELYVTGLRVRAKDKKIANVNGKRTTNYITDRKVMGLKVGVDYKEAIERLEKFGYELIFEEVSTSSLPTSREVALKKGIIIISLAVETGGDVSSFNAWIPYDTSEIDAIFTNSHLPAELGLVYNCYASTDPVFTYYMKNEDQSGRVYKADDGSIAVMLGYPDISDYIMCSQVTFSDSKYDVDGASVGMTFDECIKKLTATGWTLYKDSSTLTKGDVTLKLFDVDSLKFNENPTVIGGGSKVVTFIRVYLPAPSRMDSIDTSNK